MLDEVQQKIENEKAQEAIERAKDTEDKDTKVDQDNRGNNEKTPRPTRTPKPSTGGRGRG